MKKLFLLFCCAGYLISSCNNPGGEKLSRSSSDRDSMSYAIGVFEASEIKRRIDESKLDVNTAYLMSGIYDVLTKDSIEMSNNKALEVINSYMLKMQEKYKRENIDFLEKTRKSEGIDSTESGLLYQIIKEGEGISPKPTDTVEVHYTGTLMDGTKFDSSHDHGKPLKTSLNSGIRGWIEGLQMMKEGASYKLFIPAELGYGDRYAGPTIRPGSALIFEVELLKVYPDNSSPKSQTEPVEVKTEK
ncbi:MAG: FKBP-type peptidyl-prolyl cis-trans isomerase [Prevotellaceae bacterium]|jgi:FKBP-type peptidyl-prolyl cis-trans isomerase|nr:FKBP-type peptidyl-prolyl cis-trans isomerase [Prevotellaceae bacterium]